jgi:hypothetical protein
MNDDNICEFCGAYWNPHYGMTPRYQCGTLAFLPGIPTWEKRSTKCYEAELAALRSLVQEMVPPLEQFRSVIQDKFNAETPRLDELLNRPEVKAIMKEKP